LGPSIFEISSRAADHDSCFISHDADSFLDNASLYKPSPLPNLVSPLVRLFDGAIVNC
jgi:hypothetical protein